MVNGAVATLSLPAASALTPQPVPESLLAQANARVYSYDILGSIVALPVGAVTAGPLATHFGTDATLLGGAVLIAIATGAALCSRDIRTLKRKAVATAG